MLIIPYLRTQEAARKNNNSQRTRTSEYNFGNNYLFSDLALPCSINTEAIENIIVDEVNERTYIVMAERTLTDGELYSVIRLELLARKSPPARGEKLVISAAKWHKPKG